MRQKLTTLFLVACFLLAAFSTTAQNQAVAKDEIIAKGKPRVLFVTQSKGYVHSSVKRSPKKEGIQFAPSELAMMQLAKKSNLFKIDLTQDCKTDFTKENLQNYDIVMFYTSGELPIAKKDQDYFINVWLKQKGHGFIGIHSAMDTYRAKSKQSKQNEEYRWFWEMCGGSFNGHPWNRKSDVTLTIHDTNHPVMKPFGKEYQIKDEIYQYFNWQPKKVRVLMSLNMEKCNIKKPYHVPVAWVKSWGEGKVYCNNLGHNETTWANPDFTKSIENSIRWINNDLEGCTTPNPEVSKTHHEKSIKDAAK